MLIIVLENIIVRPIKIESISPNPEADANAKPIKLNIMLLTIVTKGFF